MGSKILYIKVVELVTDWKKIDTKHAVFTA